MILLYPSAELAGHGQGGSPGVLPSQMSPEGEFLGWSLPVPAFSSPLQVYASWAQLRQSGETLHVP